MKSLFRISLFLFLLTLTAGTVSAQPNIPGYVDPALNHNRLLREQMGEGVYKLIATYKVTGTSYLFGARHPGDLYSQEATAYNIKLSYDTYNQFVEFYSSANPDQPLIKEPGTVDSFVLRADPDMGLSSDQRFVYGPHAGATDKSYYQVIYQGPKYSVYKRYKSELGYVSSNYVQSELRQFDLTYDYFYFDHGKKAFRKLKANAGGVTKEFRDVKDVSAVATNDAFTQNPNEALRNVFILLNQ
jgi:hypothetical protein